MAKTLSTMLALGTAAPTFSLPEPGTGQQVSLSDFEGAKALLVIFMCNHCPFVKHLQHELASLVHEYQPRGLAAVGISSNDVANYPDDGPDKMVLEVEQAGYSFPYLYDADQTVARAYRAACTPDFFLFDQQFRLVYRGQFDDSRPGSEVPVTGRDLRAAIEAVLSGAEVDPDQRPSMGCNIKWASGNEPDYC
jgi:peroxiredoxin